MIAQTINPYDDDEVILTYSEGLDYIIDEISDSTSLEDAIINYLETTSLYPTPYSPAFDTELRSIIKNAENSFVNNKCKGLYDGARRSFVNAMTIPSFIDADTVDTIPDRIADIESYIPQRSLSVDEQKPLFLATLLGTVTYEYLIAALAAGDTDWQDFFDAALTSATANLPFWTVAAMEGALIGVKQSPRGLIPPTTRIVTTEVVSALIGAWTTTVGIVCYKWVKRVQHQEINKTINSKEILLNDPDGRIFLNTLSELQNRVIAQGIDENYLNELIENNEIDKVVELLGYTKEEYEKKIVNFRNAIKKLRIKFPEGEMTVGLGMSNEGTGEPSSVAKKYCEDFGYKKCVDCTKAWCERTEWCDIACFAFDITERACMTAFRLNCATNSMGFN